MKPLPIDATQLALAPLLRTFFRQAKKIKDLRARNAALVAAQKVEIVAYKNVIDEYVKREAKIELQLAIAKEMLAHEQAALLALTKSRLGVAP